MTDRDPARRPPFTDDASGIAAATNLRGRVCIVTGGTRGIGRATALSFARLGADVVVIGRDDGRLETVRREAEALGGSGRVFPIRADFASLAEVQRAADEIVRRWSSVAVLVNNAGINSARRVSSTDGYELTFAVNHLAPFLFTTALVPLLEAGSPARIVNVMSVFAHAGRVDLADPMFARRRYSSTLAYTQSKVATAMFTIDMAERLDPSRVTVNGVSPGLVATHLLREHWYFGPAWLRALWTPWLLTPERAAERVVRVATSVALAGESGRCYAGSTKAVRWPAGARDARKRGALWKLSESLVASARSAAAGV